MPSKTKRVAQSVARGGKKVLATDTAQRVVGTVADKMEEVAVDKADDVSEAIKDKAAKAGGRRKSPSRKKSQGSTPSRKNSTRKKSTRQASRPKPTGRKKSSAKTSKKSARRKIGRK
jgi:hypothetical protein